MKKLNKLFKYFVYVMPAALFFSYEPVMRLGVSESMNFELSIPLIWLVLFDLLVIVMMVKKKLLLRDFKKKWVWLLFPVWLSLSVLWSMNFIRGILTAGIIWLLYLAIDGIWTFRKLFDKEFKRVFLKWFFGASLVICAVCILQCVLDLVGVAREYSLICQGCTYAMFGFPHPDGFSIEPQFMGNLLLAPTLVAVWLIIGNHNSTPRTRVQNPCRHRGFGANSRLARLRNVLGVLLLIALLTTLFLTFSRGAIYAFVVGLLVMCGWMVVEAGKERKNVLKRVGLVWGVVILSFGLALNIQGLMAELSPTDDTYKSGVAKVLNQLTLGVVKIDDNSPVDVVENSVENDGEKVVENSEAEKAAFDGYVEESTDTRLRLAGAGLKIWSSDFATAVFGVGLGGAGEALYVNNLSPAPKEIVQNQYVSILLETGLVGVSLLIVTIVLAVRLIMKQKTRVLVLCLMIAYTVSLCFFSGLPNALHIYLLPAVLMFL